MTFSRLLTRSGVQLSYEVHNPESTATPLILTHGYGSSKEMWRVNVSALSALRPVIIWDIRGHGDTIVPHDPSFFSAEESVTDMLAILDACGYSTSHIGGLSLGGYLSLCFWMEHATRVTSLVLIDTGPGYRNDEARDTWNARAFAQAARLERDGDSALGSSPETKLARHDPVGLALAARGIMAQSGSRVIDSLKDINVATLVVVGANDEPFLGAAAYMSSRIRDAKLVTIPDAGHSANIDQPRAVEVAVNDFLQSRS